MTDGSSGGVCATAAHFILTYGKVLPLISPLGTRSTGGWWREKPALRRAERQVRYALVVSLRAPTQVDLYTPIETAVGILVEVEI
jgi:hypothetical protein